jgi:hypothetical protein
MVRRRPLAWKCLVVYGGILLEVGLIEPFPPPPGPCSPGT